MSRVIWQDKNNLHKILTQSFPWSSHFFAWYMVPGLKSSWMCVCVHIYIYELLSDKLIFELLLAQTAFLALSFSLVPPISLSVGREDARQQEQVWSQTADNTRGRDEHNTLIAITCAIGLSRRQLIWRQVGDLLPLKQRRFPAKIWGWGPKKQGLGTWKMLKWNRKVILRYFTPGAFFRGGGLVC